MSENDSEDAVEVDKDDLMCLIMSLNGAREELRQGKPVRGFEYVEDAHGTVAGWLEEARSDG